MPECKQYGGITRDELVNLRKDLANEGVTVPEGDDVKVKGPYGIELRAAYDERKETLKILQKRISNSGFFLFEL